MTTSLSLLLSLLAMAAPVLADDAADEAAILRALHAACDAYRVGDSGFLVKVLDDRFTLTDTHGAITTKEQELTAVREGEPRYEVFRNSDMRVRLYGDAALVNGLTTVKGTAAGKAFQAQLQFTDTLIRRNGEWKLAASHVSPLASTDRRTD